MSRKPTVSFLVPNIGGTSLGFATAFARALEGEYRVEVVGSDFWGSGVNGLYRGAFDYKAVPAERLYRFPEFFRECRKLGRALEGDLVVAVKATAQTVWTAWREKRRRGCKAAVCLDEWDGALMARRTPAERRAVWRRNWMHPTDENYFPVVEKWLLPRMDLVVSTSTFLQRKFGGVVVRHGVDLARFRPPTEDRRREVRRSLGLEEEHKVCVFGGVVRPHKGVELILEAMERTGDPSWRFLVVGPETELLRELAAGKHGERIVAAGPKPSSEMPDWLGAGDVTVLPLGDDLLAQSQVPCKVYEAMATGIPVIASAVSDLPEILGKTGKTFPVGDASALAGLLEAFSADRAAWAGMGRAARRRCAELYSTEKTRETLCTAVAGLLGRQ